MNVGIALRAGLSNDNFVNSLIVEFFSAIVIVAVVTTLVYFLSCQIGKNK